MVILPLEIIVPLDDLILARGVLLRLAEEYGLSSNEAANLIESRRLVEAEMRSRGWEEE